jgi:hypothetical protein
MENIRSNKVQKTNTHKFYIISKLAKVGWLVG